MPERRVLFFLVAIAGALLIGAASLTVSAQSSGIAAAKPPDIQQAHAVLARVLARPEFGTSPAALMMDRWRRRVANWFLRTWDRLVGRRVAPRAVAEMLAWILALAALAAIATWVARAALRTRPASDIGASPPVSARKTSRMWAREALAAGDPREAVRCLYNAAICRIEEEGAWKADESRTPREYVRLLPLSHARRGTMEQVAGLFEQVWYRARPASPDDGEQVARELEVLGCVRSGRVI